MDLTEQEEELEELEEGEGAAEVVVGALSVKQVIWEPVVQQEQDLMVGRVAMALLV